MAQTAYAAMYGKILHVMCSFSLACEPCTKQGEPPTTTYRGCQPDTPQSVTA